MKTHKLDGVTSTPSGVFKQLYVGVSKTVLIFTKIGVRGTDRVWFYNMDADGLSLDDKRQPVPENDIPDLLERWKGRNIEQDIDQTKKAFFVLKVKIAANGYDLSINHYKETEYAEVNYESPKGILQMGCGHLFIREQLRTSVTIG